MARFISYYRVSTQRQGRSGLGLEAQKASVKTYLAGLPDAELLAEYQDIESGAHDDRPELQKAISHCLASKATLIIAKLDRLSRNAAFLLRLQESRVNFLALDVPGADRFTVAVMGALAQRERELASQRTKDALAAAKARGKKLGGYRENAFRGDYASGPRAAQKYADDRAIQLAGYIRKAQKDGVTIYGIAKALNGAGMTTARGCAWSYISVRNVIKRLDAMGL